MKLTITKNLIVRSGAASLTAPAYQQIAPGSEVEVDGTLYNGDSFENINTWYKDAAGNYYWSGAVSEMPDTASQMNYGTLAEKLAFNWTQSQGKNVTTVIIDSGMIMNSAFFNTTLASQINLADDNYELYHGNFIAGIIAGTGTVKGLAQNTTLLSIRYKSNNVFAKETLLNNLSTALDTVLGITGPVVINISQGFLESDMDSLFPQLKNEIIQKIKTISAQQNKFFVCAAGDNKEINNLLFPASVDSCIGVGCISKTSVSAGLSVTAPIQVLAPLCNFSSYNNSFSLEQDNGSSFATATITALISNLLSANSTRLFTKEAILTELANASVLRNNFVFTDPIQDLQFEII